MSYIVNLGLGINMNCAYARFTSGDVMTVLDKMMSGCYFVEDDGRMVRSGKHPDISAEIVVDDNTLEALVDFIRAKAKGVTDGEASLPVAFPDGKKNYIALLEDGSYCMTKQYDP